MFRRYKRDGSSVVNKGMKIYLGPGANTSDSCGYLPPCLIVEFQNHETGNEKKKFLQLFLIRFSQCGILSNIFISFIFHGKF